MSDYDTIIEERGEYRAKTVLDRYPHEPEFDNGCPVLQVEPSGWGGGTVSFTGYGRDSYNLDGIDVSAEDALQHFVSEFGWGKGIEVFTRYVAIYHGGQVVTHVGRGWREPTYVAYTTEKMARVAWGQSEPYLLTADISEWAAYVEGDVYGVVIERKVNLFTEVTTTEGDLVRHEEDEDWEEVESCWGYYGEKYAEQAAREELALYAPEVAA